MMVANTWAATVYVCCPYPGCNTMLLAPSGRTEHSREDAHEGGLITCVGCGERYRLPVGYVLIWGPMTRQQMMADFQAEVRAAG